MKHVTLRDSGMELYKYGNVVRFFLKTLQKRGTMQQQKIYLHVIH